MFTLWAPLDGTYDATQYLNMDSASVMDKFIKQHLAEFGYQVVGKVDSRVVTMNQKHHDFTNTHFDDAEIKDVNIPASNGIMHILNGISEYRPNLYEYLDIVSKQLSEEIGYVTVSLVRDKMEGCDRRTTPAHNFINDAMRRAADADISFINMGGVRADLRIGNGSDRRPVTLMDIYSMLPFDDTMYVYEITYEELIDVFTYSLDNKAWGVLTSMTGIDCYFMIDPTDDGSSGEKYLRRILSALVKDGEVIWKDGRWAEGWKDRKVRIVTSEFSATTNRNKGGMDNPLCGYNGTDRLVSNDTVLREAVIKALKDEAAENDGHLNVDTDTHFIFREYEGI